MDKINKNKQLTLSYKGYEVKSRTNPIIGNTPCLYGVRESEEKIQDNGIQATELTPNEPVSFDSFDQAPYINTEWYNPIHHINDDLIIQYFLTDRQQEDYFKDLYNKEFLVIIDFNGVIFRRKVKAGNHVINLGKPTQLGENYFSIQCIDLSNNFESCIHYKHLRVIDDTHNITPEQIYTMTSEDLTKYSIAPSTGEKVSDEIGAANIVGINKLLNDVRNAGYRKIIFYNPNGDTDTRYTYYLQPYNTRENPITIPNGLTVDLNRCKWKQLVSYGHASLLVVFEADSVDCHLINGHVWGDYDEHIVNKNDPEYPSDIGAEGIEGEGYNLIRLSGAYNSIEKLNVGWVTGYSIHDGANNFHYLNPITTFANGYVDAYGIERESDGDIWICDYFKLDDQALKYKYLHANPYGGYSGLCGKVNDEYVIYYNENKEFIKREKIRQYGLSLIPKNARYVRFILCSDTKDRIENVTAVGFRVVARNFKNTTCWLSKDVYVHDCRTVAYAVGIHNHFTLENNVIEGCGQWLGPANGQVTALAIDIEDGYQHSEAFYIKNLKCMESPNHGLGSNTVNLVTTYDVHMYGENDCQLSTHKTFGLYLHDTTISKGLYVGRREHQMVGFMMIQDVHVVGDTIFNCTEDSDHPNTLIKHCTIEGQVNTYNVVDTSRVTFKNCDITRKPRATVYVSEEKHVNCIIRVEHRYYLADSSSFTNCVFVSDNDSKIRFDCQKEVIFKNCSIQVENDIYVSDKVKENGKMIFYNCLFYDDSYNNQDYIKMYTCKNN